MTKLNDYTLLYFGNRRIVSNIVNAPIQKVVIRKYFFTFNSDSCIALSNIFIN